MADNNNSHYDEWKDDDDEDDDDDDGTPNLYSLLNLRRSATEEEITRSYRSLSTTFHPDKVRRQQRISTAAVDSGGDIGGEDFDAEEVQLTFLQFKKAHEILIDPVLRLAYDSYGEGGVELIRRVQQQQREQAMRRDRKRRRRRRGGNDGDGDDEDDIDEDDDDDDDGDDDEEEDDDDDDDDDDEAGGGSSDGRRFHLYERLEDLLVGPRRNPARAKDELDRFMDQYEYHRNLTEENCVHLNLSMTLPPSVDLKGLLYDGRSYLRHVQKSILPSPSAPPPDDGERRYLQQRVMQERQIVDYQIRQLKAGQKADLGFTLSCVEPPRTSGGSGRQRDRQKRQLGPSKWSMAVGCSTNLVYPTSLEIDAMTKAVAAKKNERQQKEMQQRQRRQQPNPVPSTDDNDRGETTAEEEEAAADDPGIPKPTHPVSVFVNTSYQPNPQTTVFGTANLNNDNVSHQYSLGSTHTFSNQTAARYNLTFLSQSPLPDDAPILFGLKTYRHLSSYGGGTTSVGISASSSGQVLQWTAKWQNSYKVFCDFAHGVSVKANIGMLQGNSIELGYSCDVPKSCDPDSSSDDDRRHRRSDDGGIARKLYEWLDENVPLPKRIEASTVLGRFVKATAMVTHEITSLATSPTLGFGMEHDVSLGRWTWIWEIHHGQSTLRVPIPILRLGSVVDPRRFYAERIWYGIYCLAVQSLIAELLNSDETEEEEAEKRPPHRSSEGRDPDPPRRSAGGGGVGDPILEALPNGRSNETTTAAAAVVVVKTKSDAERQLALMRPVADAKRDRESGGGLVILEATYWQRFRVAADRNDDDDFDEEEEEVHHEVVSMDATTQLRFWVNNGRLSIPGGLSKSSWMGFYSLHTESKLFRAAREDRSRRKRGWWSAGGKRLLRGFFFFAASGTTGPAAVDPDEAASASNGTSWIEPRLTVRYMHDGRVFEITVGDTEPLALPCDDEGAAEALGSADAVR